MFVSLVFCMVFISVLGLVAYIGRMQGTNVKAKSTLAPENGVFITTIIFCVLFISSLTVYGYLMIKGIEKTRIGSLTTS